MENTKNTYQHKFFIGFAIITVVSGIYLITQGDYVIGIGGSITGLFLLYMQNTNNTENKESDS